MRNCLGNFGNFGNFEYALCDYISFRLCVPVAPVPPVLPAPPPPCLLRLVLMNNDDVGLVFSTALLPLSGLCSSLFSSKRSSER